MKPLPPEERERRNATRRRNRQEREARAIVAWAEYQAQLSALRAVRDDPAALPADRVRAVELIEQITADKPWWASEIGKVMDARNSEGADMGGQSG